MTRNGIEKNLKISPYFYNITIFNSDKGVLTLKLHFSSILNLLKFKSKFETYINNRYSNILKQYNIELPYDLCMMLFSIQFYNKIEHRGFYINLDGVVYEGWQKIIDVYGTKIILKDYSEPKETITEE